MKLAVERRPASVVVLDITAEDDEFSEAMERAYRKVSRDIQLPGFRKGRAPRVMIERVYGREVFLREASDTLMERLYRDALQQEQLVPVGDPDVEIRELEPVAFTVTVPVFPTIDPGDYLSVRAEPIDASVDDTEVEEVIARLQRSQSPWIDPAEPRSPRDGDQVTVDYEVREGDEPFQEPITDAVFVLGETNLLEPLAARLRELNVGETVVFELSYDEDDETADPGIRGKTLSYTVTLKGLKERDTLPLDDDFAKTVADVETLDDLRARIRDDLHQEKTTTGRTEVVNTIINAMAEGATVEPPEVMIDEEVDHRVNQLKQQLAQSGTAWEAYLRTQDTDEDQVRAELRPEAARRLRNSLVMQEIARREGIEISDEDLSREIDELTSAAGTATPSPEGDNEATMARMREFYQNDYFRNMLRSNLYERRLTDRLIEVGTESRGAVINPWMPPSPTETTPEASTETAAPDAEGDEAMEATAAPAPPPEEEWAAETPLDIGQPATVASGLTSESAAPADATERAEPAETPDGAANDTATDDGPEIAGEEGVNWVRGDGGAEAPADFPVKGNASSRIYHTPDSPFYDNTIAEVYFATAEDAETAGYRLPKSMQSTDSATETPDEAAATQSAE
ncbi:MAG: trigger factor [Chloroflexota bacterium]|nr:trigger factor [Chloroflexota bacterium]